MKETDELLDRLLKSARTEPEPDAVVPLGFATRVAARWSETEVGARSDSPVSWARLSLASLPFALVAAIACFFLQDRAELSEADELALARMIVQTEIEP